MGARGRRVREALATGGRRLVGVVRRHPYRSAAASVVVLVAGVLVLSVVWVRWSAQGRVHDVADAPSAPVAIVLGAGLRPDGTPSDYLEARLRDAATLYEADKVQAILVSGDHGTVAYDEVDAMTSWLVDHGVPAKQVVADHAGFDTYDSCQRARRIFGVDHALVITQDFHLPRAVFLCRQAGIRTEGVAADVEGGRRWMNVLRELPASVKAAYDAAVDPGPRYLGDHEPGIDDALAERTGD